MNNNRNNGLFFILLGILLLNSIGIIWLMIREPPAPPPVTNGNEGVIDKDGKEEDKDNKGIREDYKWEKERFSWGQRTLFPDKANPDRDRGIKAFKQGKYADAVKFFDKAVKADRQDPEVLIFYNNGKAYDTENPPLTLAVVVPIEYNKTSAEEMLRGVAMAQNEFNQSEGINGRLLEIVIANDGNNKPKESSKKVAEQLAKDSSILGVIGHNSSGATKGGLEIYEKEDLAIISPTSTSTSLMGDVFFRTVSSDAGSGEKLAKYVKTKLSVSKVVIFYNPDSNYSKSFKESFENRFEDLDGSVIIKEMNNPNFDASREFLRSVYIDKVKAALLFPSTKEISVAIEIATENFSLSDDEKLQLLGGDTLYNPSTLVDGGESFKGLILAAPWFIESPESKKFKQAGEKQWGAPVNWRTATSFDATKAFIEALSDNPSRNKVLRQLPQVDLPANETSGIGLQFNSEGERLSEPVLLQVRKGGVRPPESEFGFHLLQE